MNDINESESGYVDPPAADCYAGTVMCDVEVIGRTKINVIARGRRYGRQWLLKGLREELRDSASMQRRLQKEFEIQSRLRHPSVAQAVGLEHVDGLGLCIVQEWVDGVTLQQALRKEKMPAAERRRIIRALVETVAYLHSRGIVHRDLKPSNVMIRDIGREVVLIDFGLADTADYIEVKGPAGTPGFISPEQMEAGGVNPADDVYSLGVIMAQLAPCYTAISRRCAKPLGSRPTDASQLLKMLRRRDRRPKMLVAAALAVAVAVLAVFAVARIQSLERAARDSSRRVEELSADNAGNMALVSSLKDTLATVRGNLDDAKGELAQIAEYENLKQSLYREGCLRIDSLLTRYDRGAFTDVAKGDYNDFSIKQTELMGNLKTSIERYCASLASSSLSKEDIDKIRMDLWNYQAVKYSEYQSVWLKRIDPAI